MKLPTLSMPVLRQLAVVVVAVSAGMACALHVLGGAPAGSIFSCLWITCPAAGAITAAGCLHWLLARWWFARFRRRDR